MMPLTPAEKQKLYRERLKETNTEKLLTQNRKNAERRKRNRKKIAEYERKKKGKEESKPEEVLLVENAQILKQQRDQYRRGIYKLKTENTKF
ncbi:unnamed protein product [Parnassius mnemosyne]|uniref:BZIP domain-containing protein n=1 Tax=Parnassius mnemosyne TaxID=213953 RepID=A0AAV1LGA3_9NEOP